MSEDYSGVLERARYEGARDMWQHIIKLIDEGARECRRVGMDERKRGNDDFASQLLDQARTYEQIANEVRRVDVATIGASDLPAGVSG